MDSGMDSGMARASAGGWQLLLVLGLALGCPAGDEDGEPGSEDGTSASQDGDPDSGPGGEQDGEDDPSQDGEDDGEGDGPFPDSDCEGLVPPLLESASARIVLRNETSEVLFVGYPGECVFEPFHIKVESKVYGHEADECVALCEEVAAGVCVEGGCGPCGSYDVIRLASGAQWDSTWDGRVFIQREVPDDCGPDGGCERCEFPDSVQGAFAVEAFATSTCTGPQCECSGEEDACTVSTSGARPEDRPVLATVDAVAGEQDELTVVFR